jgi:four helix bundle protein
MKSIRFDHEKLTVYQRSQKFITWTTEVLERVPVKLAVHGQLDRASTSIPLNIAEGNGRHTAADRCHFFDIARGSTLECAAGLDVLVAKNALNEEDIDAGKADLAEITSMLVGLIRSNSESRLYEDKVPYRAENAEEGIKSKRTIKIKNSGASPLILTFLLIFILISPVPAADWPQWGGQAMRNMYSPAKKLPKDFGKIDFKPGTEDVDTSGIKNLKWVAKIGSQSYGNVTVAGGKVFVGTNNENPRDPRHQGDRSILMCFDEKTGEFLWQLVIPKLASGKVNDWENLGLLASPTVEGDRVYIVTSRCEVMCLDVNGMANGNDGPFKDEAKYVVQDVVLDRGKPTERPAPPIEPGPKDADIIWVYDMMDELGVFPHNASNCSVLIVDDLVYASTSNGQDWTHSNIPSPNAPSFIALNKHTGEFMGEDDAGIGPNILHGQWSSPSLAMVNGRKQILFGGGDGWCYAFDAAPVKDGEDAFLKTIWKYDCNPPERKQHRYPAAEGPSEINSTPVFYKNRVYVAVGQDPEHGEGVGNLVCIDATKTGDITETGTIWNYDKIHRSISTVSIDPQSGLLFVGDFSGYVYCFDAETGKLYWRYDMKAHMWGSTFVADGKVYVGDEDGDFTVLEASKGKKLPADKVKPDGPENEAIVLSETNLGSPVYSTPIVANGVVYVQSNTHLFAFHDPTKEGGSRDEPRKIDIKLEN